MSARASPRMHKRLTTIYYLVSKIKKRIIPMACQLRTPPEIFPKTRPQSERRRYRSKQLEKKKKSKEEKIQLITCQIHGPRSPLFRQFPKSSRITHGVSRQGLPGSLSELFCNEAFLRSLTNGTRNV